MYSFMAKSSVPTLNILGLLTRLVVLQRVGTIYSQNEQWECFDRFRHVKTKDGKNMDLLVEFPKGHLTLIDGLSLSYVTKCTYIFIICKINWIFKKLYCIKWNIEEYLDYMIFFKIRKFMLCNSFLGPISLRNSTTYSNFATCTHYAYVHLVTYCLMQERKT